MTKVFVYFNLHKRLFSVKALTGEKKGRVIAHVTALKLKDVEFKVSQAGRARVLREKKKNVHAGVVGYVSFDHEHGVHDSETGWFDITYNPYKYSQFVERETELYVNTAQFAELSLAMSHVGRVGRIRAFGLVTEGV